VRKAPDPLGEGPLTSQGGKRKHLALAFLAMQNGKKGGKREEGGNEPSRKEGKNISAIFCEKNIRLIETKKSLGLISRAGVTPRERKRLFTREGLRRGRVMISRLAPEAFKKRWRLRWENAASLERLAIA